MHFSISRNRLQTLLKFEIGKPRKSLSFTKRKISKENANQQRRGPWVSTEVLNDKVEITPKIERPSKSDIFSPFCKKWDFFGKLRFLFLSLLLSIIIALLYRFQTPTPQKRKVAKADLMPFLYYSFKPRKRTLNSVEIIISLALVKGLGSGNYPSKAHFAPIVNPSTLNHPSFE